MWLSDCGSFAVASEKEKGEEKGGKPKTKPKGTTARCHHRTMPLVDSKVSPCAATTTPLPWSTKALRSGMFLKVMSSSRRIMTSKASRLRSCDVFPTLQPSLKRKRSGPCQCRCCVAMPRCCHRKHSSSSGPCFWGWRWHGQDRSAPRSHQAPAAGHVAEDAGSAARLARSPIDGIAQQRVAVAILRRCPNVPQEEVVVAKNHRPPMCVPAEEQSRRVSVGSRVVSTRP